MQGRFQPKADRPRAAARPGLLIESKGNIITEQKLKFSEKIQRVCVIGLFLGYSIIMIWVTARWIGLPLFRWIHELVR